MSRILFVTTENLTRSSGANVATAELVRAMVDCDSIELALIAPTPDSTSLDFASVSTYWIQKKSSGSIKWHLRHQPSMAWALLTAMIRERPDQVIIRIGPSSVLPPVCSLLPGVQYKVLVRGFVHRNLSIQRPVKTLLWINVVLADQTIVAFEAIAEMIKKLGVSGKIKIVPNAVDPSKFTPVDESPPEEVHRVTDNAGFVVGFVGSMEKRHRVDTLVEAVASVPPSMDTALVLVGDGPQKSTIEDLVEQTGIENSTVFTGQVPHEAVPQYISSCDVLYGISDPDKPSNPIKIYEYLSCERPVITTSMPELRFVEQEKIGIALDELTVESVQGALVKLHNLSMEEREEMGRRGREYVSQNHSWSAVVDEIVGDDA